MTAKQRSYQAFLRAAKAEYGLSHKQAQKMYRDVRDRLDRAPLKADISRHPRISTKAAKAAAQAPEKPRKAAAPRPKEKAAEKEPRPSAASRKAARREFYEDAEDFVYYEDPLEGEY